MTPKQRKRIEDKIRQTRHALRAVSPSDAIRDFTDDLMKHENNYPKTSNKKQSELPPQLLDDPDFRSSRKRMSNSEAAMADHLRQARKLREQLAAVLNEEITDFDFDSALDSKIVLRAMKVARFEPIPFEILIFLAKQGASHKQRDVRDMLAFRVAELVHRSDSNKLLVGEALEHYLDDEDAWIRLIAVCGLISINQDRYEKYIVREWKCKDEYQHRSKHQGHTGSFGAIIRP